MQVRALASIALAVLCLVSSSTARELDLSPRMHPWGRFEPGVWKLVRVTTETLNDRGEVVSASTADTRTTLVGIDNEGVTLEVQACVEVAGKRFQAEPQTVKQGFHGELTTPNLKVGDPVEGRVTIEGRKVPCSVYRIEIPDAQENTAISLYCSPTVAPYVLKRETTTTANDGKSRSQTTVEVIAQDMPIRVRGEMRSGSYVRTIHKNSKGTVTTIAVVVSDVPGGVVSHNCKEVDPEGHVIRRSTLELLDYNAEPDHSSNRRRSSRRAK